MSEPSDDDKPDDGGKVREKLDVPATRKQEAIKDDEPPARPSGSLSLEGPLTFPDDGPFSRKVRLLDSWIGKGEQVVLVALLVVMILVCAADALMDKLANDHVEAKEHVIVLSTFAIAMIGTAYATQQSRNLAMDLVSRRLSPRARLVLKVMIGVFTWLIVGIVARAGLRNMDQQEGFPWWIATLIPLGCALIALHTLLHIAIDIDYLKRGKTPPERMRSGH